MLDEREREARSLIFGARKWETEEWQAKARRWLDAHDKDNPSFTGTSLVDADMPELAGAAEEMGEHA